MANPYFSFKQFTIWQDKAAMKVTTDACLFGAWVSAHLQQHKAKVGLLSGASYRLADIGAGTGLLSLMIHQKNPAALLEGLEIDPLAAAQATQNITEARAEHRIKILTADATLFTPAAPYEVIVSNPPFYQDDLKASHQKRNWAFHDETLTLSQLVVFISKNLTSSGVFYLMIPSRREQETEELLLSADLMTCEKLFIKTGMQHRAHRLLLMGKRRQYEEQQGSQALPVEEICINDGNEGYSLAFKELLRDYYLFL
jgi:tRNA1Val (adenine37-N6)-methyltransferase